MFLGQFHFQTYPIGEVATDFVFHGCRVSLAIYLCVWTVFSFFNFMGIRFRFKFVKMNVGISKRSKVIWYSKRYVHPKSFRALVWPTVTWKSTSCLTETSWMEKDEWALCWFLKMEITLLFNYANVTKRVPEISVFWKNHLRIKDVNKAEV